MENNYNFDPMTGERIIRDPEAQKNPENTNPSANENMDVVKTTENMDNGAMENSTDDAYHMENGNGMGNEAGHVESEPVWTDAEPVQEDRSERKSEDATWVTSYEEEKKAKRKSMGKSTKRKGNQWGFFKKAGAAVVLAAVFGGVAGGSFYGVCYGTGLLSKYEQATSASQRVSKDKEIASIRQTDVTDGSQAVKVTNFDNGAIVTTDISAMVQEVIPSLVIIQNTGTSTQYDIWGRSYSTPSKTGGSGIIIGQNDDEILIVTNYHVAENADKLEITFTDDTTVEAKLKGADSDMDVAVVAVDLKDLSESTKNAIAIAKLGDSDNLKLGEPAVVIGNALGYGISVTNGVISALDRELTREDGVKGSFIQTDAAINHGNSGGALFNIKGEVIGITSGKSAGSDVDNMGYAIPISAVSNIIQELMTQQTRKEKVADEERGYIGVSLQTFDDMARSYYNIPEGAFVYSVFEGSGAEKAGIYRGDVITKVENQKVGTLSDIKAILQYYKQGDVVKVTIKRLESGEYVEHVFEVTLGGEN